VPVEQRKCRTNRAAQKLPFARKLIGCAAFLEITFCSRAKAAVNGNPALAAIAE
jgi:hypothetical protein